MSRSLAIDDGARHSRADFLLNLLRQLAPMLIVASGMTFVITTGGIELSVGSIVALTNAYWRRAMCRWAQ